MTHKELRLRRRDIAKFVKSRKGVSSAVGEAARQFGVGEVTVRVACREYGVAVVRREYALGSPTSASKTYSVLSRLCNSDDPMEKIATRHGVTRQHVQHIYTLAREAGVPVRVRKRGPNRSKK